MRLFAVVLWLLCAACAAGTSQSRDTTPQGPACSSDTDCTAGRVCWSGHCEDPAVIQGNP